MIRRLIALLRGSRLGRRLASGGAVGLGARLGKAVLSITVAALLARLLAPAAFGVFLLGQTVALFGSVVAVLGLENTLVREVARLETGGDRAGARATTRRARRLCVLGALAVAGILVLGRDVLLRRLFEEPELAAMAGWMAAWTALEAVNRLQVSALRGEHRLAVAATLDGFLRAAVFLGTVGALAAVDLLDLERVFVAGALSAGASAAVGWWLLADAREPAAEAESESGGGRGLSALALWRRSWPLLGATVLGFVINQGDLWLVGVVAASEKAALYGSVLKLMFLISLPLLVLNRTLSSTLAEFHERGRRRDLEVLLRGATTLVTAATSVVVLGLLLFGDQILALLFGDFYSAATPILVLLAVAQLVLAATGPCGTMLMMAGHERLQLGVSAASGAYLVLGSLWAGPQYGIVGVAAVAASNKMLNNLVTLLLVRRRVEVWSHAYLSPFRAREGLSRMARIVQGYAT